MHFTPGQLSRQSVGLLIQRSWVRAPRWAIFFLQFIQPGKKVQSRNSSLAYFGGKFITSSRNRDRGTNSGGPVECVSVSSDGPSVSCAFIYLCSIFRAREISVYIFTTYRHSNLTLLCKKTYTTFVQSGVSSGENPRSALEQFINENKPLSGPVTKFQIVSGKGLK